MHSRYKIINSLLAGLILIFILTLILYSYFRIKNRINVLKINLSAKISGIINKKIEIGSISPLFFNGVEIKDLYIYEDILNKKIAYINSIKIRIKIMDILTKKISVDKSITGIVLDNFKINLDTGQIEKFKNFKFTPASVSNTNSNTPSFPILLEDGIISINDKKNNSHFLIKNNHSKIHPDEGTINLNVKIFMQKLYGLNLKNSFFYLEFSGNSFKRQIKGKGGIYDITVNNHLLPEDLKYILKMDDKINIMDISLYDNSRNIKLNFKKKYNSLALDGSLKKFPILDYNLTGHLKLNKNNNNLNYNIFLKSNPADRLLVNIKGTEQEIKLKDLKIYFDRERFVYASGGFAPLKEYSFQVWFNNLKYKNFNFLGKAEFINNEKDKNLVKLADFRINDLLIRKYIGRYEIINNVLKLKTYYSSENFLINVDGNLNTKNLSINLDLNNFNAEKFYKLIKINYDQAALLNGNVKLKFNNNALFVNNKMAVSFSDDNPIKKIDMDSNYNDESISIDYKVVLKNNRLILIKGQSTKLNNFKGTIDYNKVKKNFSIAIDKMKNDYIFHILFDNALDLNVKYFNDDSFHAVLKYGKRSNNAKDPQYNIKANAAGNFNHLENTDIKGNIELKNLMEKSSVLLNFRREKNKILLRDIKINFDKNLLTGNGSIGLYDKKINVNFNKMNINGTIEENKLNLYLTFNKYNDFYYNNSLFNLNGFMNIKYSVDQFRIYADLNIYNFKNKKIIIPEIYTVFIYENHNYFIKKLNIEYKEGKINCDFKNSLYIKDGQFHGETIIKAGKINYDSNLINAKMYTKFSIGKKIDLKLKIFKFDFNDLEIEDIDENVTISDDTVIFRKINDNGINGEIKLKENRTEYALNLQLKDTLMKFDGFKTGSSIDYILELNNFDLEFSRDAVSLIKDMEGRVNSKLFIKGAADDPRISGYLKGRNLYLKLPEIINTVKDFNLNISIKDNIVEIQECTGQIGKGKFSLLGTALLKNYWIDNYDLYFQTLDKYGIYIERKQNDLMGNVQGKVKIKGNKTETGIAGRVICNNFDLTWPLEDTDLEGNNKEISHKLILNFDIEAGQNVNFFQDVNNINVLIKEGGKFHLQGEWGKNFKVGGKMEAEKGYLDYFGTRFEIITSYVDFSPYYHENVPWVSARAESEVKGIDDENVLITMTVEGRADNDLAPKLNSTPALTPREIFLLLNDSSLYISDKEKDKTEEDKEINSLIKTGFIQIFDSTYRTKFITPIERKARRFLGLDLLRIQSSLAKNLLEPKLYQIDEHNKKGINPFSDTQLSVGKYITDSLLFKYSVYFKENIDYANVHYEQKFGFEWKIIRSLNFEWMYYPLYFNEYSNPSLSEQKYKLEWKQKFSF